MYFYYGLLQEIGTPSVDGWGQPWSEQPRPRILPALAVALAVSGSFLAPLPPPGPDVASTWFSPFVDPVRVPARLLAGENPFRSFVAQLPETVLYDKWNYPWSEPVRTPARLTTGSQSSYAGPTTLVPNTIPSSSWYIPFADPVRVPLRLAPALNQVEPDNPYGMTRPETIWESTWHFAFTDPVRVPARLITGAQLFYTSYIEILPAYPNTPNWRLTVRNQGKGRIPAQGNAWTSPHKYPPVNEA